MAAADGSSDWYADNVQLLAIVFACSIATFVVVFLIVTTCVRMQFSGRSADQLETMDTPELVGIKSHTRATRLLSLAGVALQVLLVLRLTSRLDDNNDDARSSSKAYTFSLFRGVSNLCVYFLGFMTNTHAFFRLLFLVLLGEMVVTDTIAQVTVTMVANCLQAQGLRCGNAPSSLHLSDLQFLQLRDLFCLFLNPWLALEVAYLGLTIGFCSSRYSSRRLSLSRPRFNIRAALAFYFPTQFALNATQVHSLRTSRRRHHPKQWRWQLMWSTLTGLSIRAVCRKAPKETRVKMDGGVGATPVAFAAAPLMTNDHTVAHKKRRVFYVKLSASECTEVDYKKLVRDYERVHGTPSVAASAEKPRAIDTNTSDPESSANSPFPEEMVGGLPLSTPRTQRFDIIEHLEKRYGAGAVVGRLQADVKDGGGANDDYAVRGDDDNLYDSEDSFIDDEELHQNIEEIHTQARVKTKHAGFFVNAGDAIETIEGETLGEDDDGENDAVTAAGKKTKRPKKSGGAESTKAARAFLDEWSEAASEWQPGADIVEGIETMRRAVRELGTPFTKTFPRQLDDPLRAVDRLVVDAHPNKWRVNGYFATLMTFLPFTKQYLKTNMLRLEARDATRAIKEEIENAIASMAKEIDVYAQRAEDGQVEEIREELLKDKEIALSLHRLLLMLDEWITKENDYRQMLKSDDKKLMKEADYTQLNARQERNRLFNRVLALFPPALMDLPSLRGLSKAGKAKGSRKPTAAAPSKATPSTKSPASTPKKKLPVVVVAEVASATPAKRSIKPFKSRMMDDAPPFSEEDFEEIL